MPFTIEDLLKKLRSAEGPSRELDGDVWWMLSFASDEDRNVLDRTGYVREAMEREGSPGKGLNCFVDTSRRPPSLLDYANKFTFSLTEALLLVKDSDVTIEIKVHRSTGLTEATIWKNSPNFAWIFTHKEPAIAVCGVVAKYRIMCPHEKKQDIENE